VAGKQVDPDIQRSEGRQVTRTYYTDPYDDPNDDPEDIKYGDYDSELGDGFSVVRFDDAEGDDDDSA
jgi:hypothetical protein